MASTLFVSYDGLTDSLGQSQVIPYLDGLASRGHQISVISFEKPDAYARRKELIQSLLDKAGITWLPQHYHKRPPILSTVLDVRAAIRAIRAEVRAGRADLIHCRGYIPMLAAMKATRKLTRPLLFDMRGFWPEERMEAGLWPKKHPIYGKVYRYFKRFELRALRAATHTIVLTRAARTLIHREVDKSLPIDVVPCCADLDHFTYRGDAKRREIRERLGLTDEFVLVYLGSVGTWYLLAEMMMVFKGVQQTRPGARFLLITRGDQEMIRQTARDQGVDPEALIIQPLDRADIPDWLSAADASVFFCIPGIAKIASSPTKHGEVLGAGLVALTNGQMGDMRLIAPEAGVVVEDFDSATLQSAASQLVQLAEERNRDRSRAVAKKYYDLQAALQTYASVYEKCLQ